MIWVDRLAIVWACLVLAVLALIEATVLPFAALRFAHDAAWVLGFAVLPPWLVLRGLVWTFRP